MMTTSEIPMGTRLAASVHRRAAVRTTVTYVTSFVAEMHATGSKAEAEITMALIMTDLTSSILLKDTFQEV
jgi:hypothetical protein